MRLWICRMRGISYRSWLLDEYQATGGHHRPTVIFRASLVLTLGGEIGVLAQRNPPGILAGVEIDRVQGAPGGRTAGYPSGSRNL